MKHSVSTAGLLSLMLGMAVLLCSGVLVAVTPEQVPGLIGPALFLNKIWPTSPHMLNSKAYMGYNASRACAYARHAHS